ncbi:GFA family protein [Amphritea balenae]|uniref:GFA family protein n=1 Tax=Amphritea balenae TaxID=452629 RepID=A0A3P1SPY8_9GAMM|nr:GFA family protein [Amphritea balenae]RRC99321.1 GFA family protein [Amphritea balenae]GGK72059.1 aldehyde-activating protein [Amphritea balenae]
MNNSKTYNGSCFCGAVTFTLKHDPALMAYCHCESCRHWSAGPVNAFTLWPPEAVTITQGSDQIGSFNKTPETIRKWCKSCGGHLFIEHPAMGLIDVPASVIPEFNFQPALHVNYQETVLRMRDGLPKMKDLPQEAGGSGLQIDE